MLTFSLRPWVCAWRVCFSFMAEMQRAGLMLMAQ